MLSRFACLLLVISVVAVSRAQAPDTLWNRTYGGEGRETCYSLQQTADGGYILGGYSGSYGAGSGDVYLVKTNADGDTLWTKTYGGQNGENGQSVQLTTDGGYILGGYTFSYGIGGDVYLVKTDANGDTAWTRTYGGDDIDWCNSLQQTTDGGYILGGGSSSFGAGPIEFYLVKTNAVGDTLWTRTYGGSSGDICHSVQQTSDGGYILGGLTYSYGAGGEDIYLVKTDAAGDTLWTRTYGGDSDEVCSAVQQTSDGGYILGGSTASFGVGGWDFYLVKTDADGDTMWTRTYGGSDSEECKSLQQTIDGGYLLGGGDRLVRTDANGEHLWTGTYGGNHWDNCNAVLYSSEGVYIMAGFTESFGADNRDFWLTKIVHKEPVISSISDVGNDQGRQVRIRWNASYFDDASEPIPVTSYSIYRRIDLYRNTDPVRQPARTLDWPPGDWEYILTVPARTEETYATIVPTLADSSSEGIYWSTFFVSAGTANPGIFFDSPVDSGYSVDNLAPEATLITAGLQIVGNDIVLRWDEVTTGGGQPEQNGIWYRVYGSIDPEFSPDYGNLLTTTQSLSYSHPITKRQFYFKILVSDDH